MIRRAAVFALILSNGQSALGGELPTALDYLNRMGTALQTLNYHGTAIYWHDGQIESIQVIHKMDHKGEFERLVHLSGEPREVIRTNDIVTCYMPDSQSVTVGKRDFNGYLLSKLGTDFKPFLKTYSFKVGGLGRIADQMARIIEIHPKDAYRYGYRLWISNRDFLLLKSELLSPAGVVLEQLMFAQIEVVDHIPDEMLRPAVASDKYTWHNEKQQMKSNLPDKTDWAVRELPTGFKLSTYSLQQMPNSNVPADHMVVSDGLATISVYVEQFSAESQPFVGASHLGAINIYGAVVGDYQVTVVGEVPDSTVRMVAESVHLQKPGDVAID